MKSLYIIPEDKAPNTGIGSGVSDFLGNVNRNFNRVGTKAIGAAAGGLGNIASAALNLGEFGSQKLLGVSPGFSKASEYLPTSEKITSTLQEAIGKKENRPSNYFEPANTFEKYLDDTVETLVSLVTGIPGLIGGVGGKVAATLTGAKELGKFAAEKLGFGQTGQEVAGLGGMLASSIIGAPRVVQKASELYESAGKNLPKKAPFQSDIIRKGLDQTSKNIQRLPNESAVVKEINQVLGKVEEYINPVSNSIDLNDILTQKKFINRHISESAREYLFPLIEAMRETISSTKSKYPEFARDYLGADKLFSSAKAAEEVGSFIGKQVDISKVKNPFIAGLFTAGAGLISSPFVPGLVSGSLKGIGAAFSTKAIAEAGHAIVNSPEARKYYADVVKGALKQSAPVVIKSLNKLDAAIEKEKKRSNKSGLYLIE